MLDGQWDEVLQFIQPLECMDKFDRKRCVHGVNRCQSRTPRGRCQTQTSTLKLALFVSRPQVSLHHPQAEVSGGSVCE